MNSVKSVIPLISARLSQSVHSLHLFKSRTLAFLFLSLSSFVALPLARADGPIYRCGNEYTNTVTEAQSKTCKLISGGNVTVVQAYKPPVARPQTASSSVRSEADRARDSDARLILESELKKAIEKQAELQKEYNNGEPEKIGAESKNYQKYLDRVAELKATIARNDADIAGIRRELDRLPPASSGSSGPVAGK